MAKIYPEHLPQVILDDPKRQAEVKVYDALASMDNAFMVFYNVAWQARNRGVAKDGEADFVIIHPNLGVLVLEVKGGGIKYDSTTWQWHSVDRNGHSWEIKDPVEQARRSRYTLIDKLTELPGWDKNRFLTTCHAVAFPHIWVSRQSLKQDLPRDIVLDHDDLSPDTIQKSIQQVFDYYASTEHRSPVGKDRMLLIRDLLAHSFAIRTPLGVELEQDDEKLIQLTEQQMLILSMLRMRRRAAIAGCAGSGKTMLAVEKARRLAVQGFNVLLTCFNVALAEELRTRLPDTITILHFHSLCVEMAKESGFTLRKVSDEKEYFDVVLPEELMNAAEEQGPQFDAIIVDEGQDFKEIYWIALSSLVEPEGIFYVFYDDNQNLYGGTSALKGIVDEEPFPLPENCRNTQAIHKLVARFHSQPGEIVCRTPKGNVPELIYHRDASQLKSQVQSKLHQLIVEEHISPRDIVILTPRSQDRTQFKVGTQLGNFVLTDGLGKRSNGVQVTSIHAFKGLERRVVIIVEVDETIYRQPEVVMYVGCSRARTYLILCMDGNLPSDLKKRIEAACKG